MSEFFQVKTVREVLEGFRPAHRVETERIPVERCGGRVLAVDVTAPHALPGFARSAVDGFAVRAADTFGASEGLPTYLDVTGAIAMGEAPTGEVTTGTAIEIPTGGATPEGADAIVMIEYTARVEPTRIEVTRPVAAGDGVIVADEDAAPGDLLLTAGRGLRPQDAGMLAAAGVAEVTVSRQPVVALISTGDEVVPPATSELAPGQVRDANTAAIGALIEELGGLVRSYGIVPDDPGGLEAVCRDALSQADLLVITAGSSVGTRDATAEVVEHLGDVWCHGISIKPGKPTLLAEALGRPVIGLPGNPLSALVVMRIVGGPVIARLAGRVDDPSVGSTLTAELARNVASSTGRHDVVQVRLEARDERAPLAHPIFGHSSQLSILTRADGYLSIPDAVQGMPQGAEVLVERYR